MEKHMGIIKQWASSDSCNLPSRTPSSVSITTLILFIINGDVIIINSDVIIINGDVIIINGDVIFITGKVSKSYNHTYTKFTGYCH